MAKLIENLTRFVSDGQAEGDHLYADIKNPPDHLKLFLADEDARDMIQKWISKRELKKLAQMWVAGGTVDWPLLHGDHPPYRMALPTYPFAKERYWRVAEDAPQPVVSAPKAAALHPLLHTDISDIGRQSYSSTFSGREFFLADHQIQGKVILPGVAHLELVRAAVEHAGGTWREGSFVQLKNVVWIQPIVVETPKQITVVLSPAQHGQIDFEIYGQEAERKTVHCRGRALIVAGAEPEALRLQEQLAQMQPSGIDMEDFYATFRRVEIFHGPSYRGVTGLYRSDTHVLAKLALPAVVADSQSDYVLHPSLMESALQAACLLIADSKQHSGGPSLPFALETISIYGPCTSNMYAWVRYASDYQKDGNVIKLDVDLTDMQGRVHARLQGFSFRRLNDEAAMSAQPSEKAAGLVLMPTWRATSLATGQETRSYARRHLVLCDMPETDTAHLQALLPDAQCLILSSPQHDLAERFTRYALSCFELIRSIVAHKPDGKVLLQVVAPDDQEGRVLTGLSGLLKTAALEHPFICGQIVLTPPGGEAQDLAEQLQAGRNAPQDAVIKYRQAQRMVLDWEEVQPRHALSDSPLKDQGVYLITGGFGGIGLIFARDILRQTANARVILTGRSGLSLEKQAQLAALQRQSDRIDYLQSDVSDIGQVHALVDHIGKQYRQLNGIIHSAGIISDDLIGKKTSAGFEAILAAKVTGTFNLDLATRDLGLDFLVLFSSISAAFGNPGQADYATGNAFMDAFAAHRNELALEGKRSGRTLSLNWPLWEEGGMALSDTHKALMRQTMGAWPLPAADGLTAFYQGLNSGYGQLLVLHGAADKLRKFISHVEAPPTVPLAISAGAAKEKGAVKTSRLREIQTLLVEEVAATIQLAADKLELDVEFSQYGFDSIVLMDFVRDLNQKYGLELMPTVFFEYSTINAFAAYLDREHRDVIAGHLSTAADAAPPAAFGPVEPPRSSAPVETGFDPRPPHVPSEHPGRFQDIAIVGMDGRFPEAASVDAFWEAIRTRKDMMREIPRDHWDYRPWFEEDREAANKTYCKWGSFIDGVDRFDAEFFNISPKEAEWMDPQMRLLLQSVYRCGEDAGLINEIRGSKTGVFVGVCSHDYMDRIAELNGPINPHQGVGNAPTVIANRVSFLLNLTGPSLAFNTACSASLVALHEACHSLQREECQMAFVGGVNLLLSSHHYRYFSSIGALSPTGRSYSFDARADGYVPGETIASILLKPLAKAIQDGDRIYAIVKGSAALHGGFTPSITAPSVSGEKNVIVSAWKNAGIDPSTLGYIEAHGTGTKLGDPIEVSALTQAFQEFTPQTGFCALGSAKAHLGHTEGSAGIVGIIKAVAQMRAREIPAMPFYEELNPYIQLNNSALYINKENIPWEMPLGHPRRAGVSSFGFSGVYAHVVLEEYVGEQPVHQVARDEEAGPHLIVLSAKTKDRLRARAGDLLDFIMRDTSESLTDIAYTLQVGREAMKERLGFVVRSKEELKRMLQACLDEQAQPAGLHRGVVKGNLRDLSSGVDAYELDRLIGQWTSPAASVELLKLWVNGQPVEWRRLYGEPKPSRIRLPVYPFVGERYWLEPVSSDHPPAVAISVSQAAVASPVRKPDAVAVPGTPDLHKRTLAVLTGMVSEATKIPAHRIDADADFEELGLDSILIAELNKHLEKWTGNTDATLFFKYKTLSSLAGYLSAKHARHIEHAGPETSRPAPSVVAAADQVSSKPVAQSPQRSRHQPSADEDIAIIGMSGRYPGAKNLKAFWQNLSEGKDSIREIPQERFDYRPLFHPAKGRPDALYCKWGGFIDDVDQFDAGFFKLSPQDARFMDPQERIFLETAWECLETAGYIGAQWQRKARNIGVFAGVTFNNYQLIMAEAAETPTYLANSQTFSIANRVSYFFNFTGPSFTVDTACSSSLLAIHQACESLKRAECDVALAGGVNLSLHPSKYITLCATSFASSDGRCHAFAANGDGYVPSEGVGIVLLKPYSQAIADGDSILAIIKGTGVSHDGKTQGYTVPNPVAQSKAIEAALRQADISPEHISYVEAHGTGTALGDPIEIQGLMDVYSQYTDKTQYCAIGSVKSNIGHGEAAAGIAQLTKTVLQLQHKTLVPSLLHDQLNPNIDFERTAFYVQQEKSAWPQPVQEGEAYPRYAGISSFGAGGVNVHVIVGEAPEHHRQSDAPHSGMPLVIPLSAHVPGQLVHLATNLYQWLLDGTEQEWQFEEIAYTLQTRRAVFSHRLAFVAAGKTELLAALKAYIEQDAGGPAGRAWYETSIKQSSGFDLDLSTEEDRDYLRTLLKKGRAEKLALLWVNGTNIPWEHLYEDDAGLRCVPLPAYAFARKRYWIAQDSLKKTAANREPVRQDISAGVMLKDAMFDVQWRDMALDSGTTRSQIPVDTLLVIAEDPAVFETRRWGDAKVRSCLIADDVQPEGRYDIVLGKEQLDYEILREQIRSGGIGGIVYVPSRIDMETCSGEDLERHLQWESHKLHRWMTFLINNLVETPPKVVFLSVMQDPVQALLSKYFSFLRYEYPEFQASIIQVDRLGKETMAQIHAEIRSRSDETEVAFHGQERQVQRLIPLALADGEHELDASGCMVISGGFGGIGFKVLQWLIDKGTTELIVIGRKPATAILQHPDLEAPLAIQALIDKLGRQGVVVHYMQVDIHQSAQLAEAFEAVRGRLQQPITGVFHLAGTTTDAIPLGDMSEDTLMEVLRPKFFGAYALDKITAEDPLRYFCLFSSTAAIEGMQVNGLGAYAASNASLDALAELRRQRRKPVQLIHWSDWDEVGMAVAHGHKAFMDAVGIHMLSPASAIGILEAVLARSIPSSTVFHVDWEKFSRANGLLGKLPFFADYVRAMDQRSAPKAQPPVFAKETGDDKGIDVGKLHSEAPSIRQGQMTREQLVTYLSEKLAAMMEFEVVSPEENLSDLGLDSINSIQYFKELSVELSVDISPSLTFRYPTISKLAKYLSSQMPARREKDTKTEDPGFSVARELQAAMRRSEQLLAHTE
ncbi:SDR family NAD(P)-dependent oxidoreductase [Rhizobium sp. RCC_161_2]|uniref:SDR family NAD(P)-dependent oxidoreductase n=1 Tax=Rhizobium sp. RCC_161_2 TaxID=3239219 RepID=UPI003526026F